MPRLIDRFLTERVAMPPWYRPENPRIRNLLASARDAEVVVADSVAEYFFHTSDQEYWDLAEDFPTIAPPFDLLWIECRAPRMIRSRVFGLMPWKASFPKSWAVLFRAVPTSLNESLSGVGWRVEAALIADYGPPLRQLLGPVLWWSYSVRKEGGIVHDAGRDSLRYGMDHPELLSDVEDFVEEKRKYLEAALLTLSFLHCKNVHLVPEDPPAALSKKFQRKHARPLARYHTLQIEPMKRVLQKEGCQESQGLKRALHLCRGHFRTYSEKPLFGRVRGRFFIPQHLRGSPSEGVVVKDYLVNPPRSEHEPPV